MKLPLAAHPRARQVQSGMPGSPVAVRAGASLLGRRLPSRVRQHSALSAVSCREHSVVMATELSQPRDLARDLACGTPYQSSCVILTSPVDCSDDTFFEKHEHGAL